MPLLTSSKQVEVKTVILVTNIGNNIAEAKMIFKLINSQEVNLPFTWKNLLWTKNGIKINSQDVETAIQGHQRDIDFIKKIGGVEEERDEPKNEAFSYNPMLPELDTGISLSYGKYRVGLQIM